MRLFLAALHSNGMMPGLAPFAQCSDVEKQHILSAHSILESYHYYNEQRLVDVTRAAGRRVFLDSGAYSAYTQGAVISLDAYCRFIQEHGDVFEAVSVLDAIGDPLKTWQNQQEMERRGIQALPCFHAGEDPRYCEHYANRYEYITLGGMVGSSSKALIRWLDDVWEDHLIDGSGRAKLKVHGFGITAIAIMERYPWYSVDSSSWVQISSFGSIIDPDFGVIQVSGTSPARKMDGQHFETLTDIERLRLLQHFEALGYSAQALRDSYLSRRAYCIGAYMELNRRLNCKEPIFHREQSLLFG